MFASLYNELPCQRMLFEMLPLLLLWLIDTPHPIIKSGDSFNILERATILLRLMFWISPDSQREIVPSFKNARWYIINAIKNLKKYWQTQTQDISYTYANARKEANIMFDKNRFRAQLPLKGKYLKHVAKALGISQSTL